MWVNQIPVTDRSLCSTLTLPDDWCKHSGAQGHVHEAYYCGIAVTLFNGVNKLTKYTKLDTSTAVLTAFDILISENAHAEVLIYCIWP